MGAGLLLCAALAQATDVFLLTNDAPNTSSFTGATNWSNRTPPAPANRYLAARRLLAPTNTGAFAFGGYSLVLSNPVGTPGSGLLFYSTNGAFVLPTNAEPAASTFPAFVISNLALVNGAITNCRPNSTLTLFGNQLAITNSGYLFTTLGRHLGLYAPLAGASDATLYAYGAGQVRLYGANATFAGRYYWNNSDLRLVSDECLGPAPSSFNPDAITLTNFATLVTLTNPALPNAPADVVIPATRGITLGAPGSVATPAPTAVGCFQASYSDVRPGNLVINSPIAGTGGFVVRPDANAGLVVLNNLVSVSALNVVGTIPALGISSNQAWLVLNGTLTNNFGSPNPLLALTTNAFLCGTGKVSGTVIIPDGFIGPPALGNLPGTIAPGQAAGPNLGLSEIGTLTTANLAVTNGAFAFDLGADPAEGGADNDLLHVAGDLLLAGTNTVTILPRAGALNGVYTLIRYDKSINATNLAAGLLQANVRDAVFQLNDSGGAGGTISFSATPGSLVWQGATNNNVWLARGPALWTDPNGPDTYFDADSVVFDDTALTNTVSVPSLVYPQSVTLNGTSNFTLGNLAELGGLSGPMSLTNNNSGTLTLNSLNTFSGLTVLSAGTTVVNRAWFRNAGPLGSPAGATIVQTDATLDILTNNLANEPVVLDGGTLINSSASPNLNGLRNLTLTDKGGQLAGQGDLALESFAIPETAQLIQNTSARILLGGGPFTNRGVFSVRQGALALQPGAALIYGSGKIEVYSNAQIIATGRADQTFALTPAQTLALSGAVIGHLDLAPNATLELGVDADPVAPLVQGHASFGNASTLRFTLSNDPTPGNGLNDLLTVSNLTCAGNVRFSFDFLTGAPLLDARYPLIRYLGVFQGGLTNLTAINLGDYTAHFDLGVAGELGVTFTAGASDLPPVIPAAEPADQTAYAHGAVTFSVNPTGAAPLTYQWYTAPSSLLPNATNASLSLTALQLADDGSAYYVVVSNAFGTAASRTATLNVVPLQVAEPVKNPDGSFGVSLTALPGWAYRLQASTNLSATNWIFVAGLTNVPGPQVLLDDTPPSPKKFYRLLATPAGAP